MQITVNGETKHLGETPLSSLAESQPVLKSYRIAGGEVEPEEIIIV